MVRRHVAYADPPAAVDLLDRIDSLARPLRTPTDLDPLLQRIGDVGSECRNGFTKHGHK